MQIAQLPSLPRKRSPVKIQRAVILALVIRELRARVEGKWLSLLWMVFEPLAHVLIILALFGFRRHVVSANVEFPVFLVTGLLPFFLFRNLARRLPTAITANRGLYAYRQIRPLDALIGRCVVEIGLYAAVSVAAFAVLGWLGYHWLPVAPLELIGVVLLLVALGSALGLLFAVVGHNRPRVQTVVGLAFMPLYLLSGVIFPVQTLAVDVREILLWNPVLHLIELARVQYVPAFVPLQGVSWSYPALFTLVVAALALSLYRLKRHDLLSLE
jgi:capsular polysaccharide transport system permease protein